MRPEAGHEGKTYDDEDIVLPAQSPFLRNIHDDDGLSRKAGVWPLEIFELHGMDSPRFSKVVEGGRRAAEGTKDPATRVRSTNQF